MMKHFSDETEKVFEWAAAHASGRSQEYILVENVLYAVLDDSEIADIFKDLEISIPEMKENIINFLDDNATTIPSGEKTIPKLTNAVQRMIQFLLFSAEARGKSVHTPDILLAILQENDSMASYYLQAEGLDDYTVKTIITDMAYADEEDEDEDEAPSPQQKRGKKEKKSSLEQYATNLTEMARDGKIDPVIGRDSEVARLVQILARKKKNNALLLGEPGVGKTAIADSLALRLATDNVPNPIKGYELYSLDINSVIAGAKYRGDFEKRMQEILEELEKKEKAIIFIDEVHSMFGLGASGNSNHDATNILKPVMTTGKIKIIGATTHEEARTTVDKNKPMQRRFQKIDVLEPDEETTIKILNGLKEGYETYHGVKYPEGMVEQIVHLSGKFINDKFFPDKAIDVLDEAGAVVKIRDDGKEEKVVTLDVVSEIISKIARVPVVVHEGEEKIGLLNLEANMKAKIYGQDEAISTIVEKIIMHRAGLGEPNKPIGAYLMAGPSGSGKTETGKQLAEGLGLHLIRYDMSEFMEDNSVAKLVGAAQGYVGFEEGGRLINDIKKHPHSVIIFDEIEKAHPKIQNTFLQLLEEAELTSADGTTADFRNCLILFTSNAGTKITKTLGFGNVNSATESKRNAEIEKFFSPEFRNRLDAVIQFNPLTKENIVKVAEKVLNEVRDQLKEKNVQIIVTASAKEVLAEKGFDPQYGARPMKRTVQELIKKPIAREIVMGTLENGGTVKVDAENNELKIEYISVEKEKEIESV